MRSKALALSILLLLPATLFALPPQDVDRARHFVLEAQHPLEQADVAALAAEGVTVQRVLGANRFLVRAADASAASADVVRVRSLEAYDWSRKIARSAYAEAAKAQPTMRVRVMFHDDVSFDGARSAVEAAGGTVETPMAVAFESPRALTARIPSGALQTLARDERVFGVYGRALRPAPVNAIAAQLSHVTPLFSAPYNLSGNGVVLSEFELSAADTTHFQFGGRFTVHTTVNSGSSNQRHATHVAGTMISAGNPDPSFSPGTGERSKGMAPSATLHEFYTDPDFAKIVSSKDSDLPPLGVVADNNSWDFALAWQNTGSGWVWNGGEEFYGGYDSFYSAPYDAVAVKSGAALFVHAAGNDADHGNPTLGEFAPHKHVDNDGNTITGETFCYSQNGSGTDCPTPQCSSGKSSVTGEQHCETTRHPTYGPFKTTGVEASLKNVVTVGAVDSSGVIGSFSSRGPTQDGRIKPEVVAKGIGQFSTFPGRSYATLDGTSMATPVVTGISALIVEQWRRTFGGQTPPAAAIKTLLIAGADDQVGPATLDLPGPDYVYGFGLVDAKTSIDLIVADGATGSRIRTGTVQNGDTVEIPLALAATQNLRVTLGWFDPEVAPPADELGTPTLLNDLDLKVIDPSGATVLPYVLDKNNPTTPATRGVNTVDTTEMVEIKNAAAGQYRIIITAKLGSPTTHPAQDYVLVANGSVGGTAIRCADAFEPNDTPGDAYKFLANGQTITAKSCSATDLDFFAFDVTKAGPVSVTVTASDTPLRVTLSGSGLSPLTATVDVPAGQTKVVSATAAVGAYTIEVEPVGAVGSSATYTLSTSFGEAPPPLRRRVARH